MQTSVRDALRHAESTLRKADVGAANLDAELLLRHSLGWNRAQLLTRRDSLLTDSEYEKFISLVEHRSTGMPVQYITGSQEFYGRDFAVTPAVLIPRPETELLVEAALGCISVTEDVYIVDAGTGSGAISVTIAAERPAAHVAATDISPDALNVARCNAARHGVADRIRFAQADILPDSQGRFDVIVSNPPYVAERDSGTLPREVRDFEPQMALFAGEDGLAMYRRIVPLAGHGLRPGGWLFLELGAGQAEEVRKLLDGWTEIAVKPDFQGIPRVLCARKR